jgi:hypothetical protein
MQKLLKIYKMTLSSFLVRMFGKGCRYTPTCSQYMKEAVEKYGILYGFALGTKRFLSCHPFSKKDYYDPLK